MFGICGPPVAVDDYEAIDQATPFKCLLRLNVTTQSSHAGHVAAPTRLPSLRSPPCRFFEAFASLMSRSHGKERHYVLKPTKPHKAALSFHNPPTLYTRIARRPLNCPPHAIHSTCWMMWKQAHFPGARFPYSGANAESRSMTPCQSVALRYWLHHPVIVHRYRLSGRQHQQKRRHPNCLRVLTKVRVWLTALCNLLSPQG